MGQGLLSFLFGFPSLWLLSRSSSLISTPTASENVFIRVSLVFSLLHSLTLCKARQFCCEYWSKSSMSNERLLCVSTKCYTLSDINSNDSATLIWDFFASLWKVKSSCTWFSILFKKFTSNLANSRCFKPF